MTYHVAMNNSLRNLRGDLDAVTKTIRKHKDIISDINLAFSHAHIESLCSGKTVEISNSDGLLNTLIRANRQLSELEAMERRLQSDQYNLKRTYQRMDFEENLRLKQKYESEVPKFNEGEYRDFEDTNVKRESSAQYSSGLQSSSEGQRSFALKQKFDVPKNQSTPKELSAIKKFTLKTSEL